MGIIDLADQDMVGSVAHMLGEEAATTLCGVDCDDLFAIRLDFDCVGSTGSSKFCIDIPLAPGTSRSTGVLVRRAPTNVHPNNPLGTGMAVVERAYLHPETLAGPDEAAMVPLELLVFKRREAGGGLGAAFLGGWANEQLEVVSAWCRTLRGIPAKQHVRVFVGAAFDTMARGKVICVRLV